MNYTEFIERKSQMGDMAGFEPLWMPDYLFDFQSFLCQWAIRMGRGAIIADCGLGKTPMDFVWAENVYRKTGKPVLIIAPLAVSHQFQREAEKFGVNGTRSDNGKPTTEITITNFERLHLFDTDDFGGVVVSESSILKNFDGKLRSLITEFMRPHRYRLLETATAAPNDFEELGTSSEALGYLGYTDMITRFFKEDVIKDYLGWGRKAYRFKGHSEQPFWRWVCSWARVCRKPSDLGFKDDNFVLPPLTEEECIITESKPRAGLLFSMPARDLGEQREERRNTMDDRCQMAADKAIAHKGATVIWCQLNAEGDLLKKLIPGSEQVAGNMSDERKESMLVDFQKGNIEKFIIKPKIGCHGLNWQHCHDIVTFPSHSWEQYYQAVRRCYRFGQKHPVKVSIIASEGEVGVMANLQRKAKQADRMFAALNANANRALNINRSESFSDAAKLPSWLNGANNERS